MAVETMSPLAEARAHLAGGHEQLERLIEQILEIRRSDGAQLRSLWMPFAAILAAHLDEEDRHMVPALLQVEPREARGLVLEHRHLRTRLAQLDSAFSLATLAPFALRAFAEEVLAHHRREQTLLDRYMNEIEDTG
ncbi:MAG: hypothetical protein U0414_40285 [Polyangiaceae bacterium]